MNPTWKNPALWVQVSLMGLVAAALSGCAGQTSLKPMSTLQQGEALFATHCAGCHSGGGNAMNPAKTIKGSTKLTDKAGFIAFLRNPGGGMPPYDAGAISDSDAELLRQYLAKTYGASGRD